MLIVGDLGHIGGDGADQAVAQQDAQERAYQRSCHLLANFFRRTSHRAHGNHDAQYRGHNAQTGQGIGHAGEGGSRQPGAVVMNLEIEVEHLVQIEGIHSSNRHTQGITDKVTDVMVFENGWAFGEQLTFVRLFHVTFEGHQPVFTGLVQQVVHHFEGIDVSLPGVFGASENAANPAGNLFKDVERIGDKDGTDGRAADGDEFRGLNEDTKIAVLHQIAGHYTAENHDNADNREHAFSSLSSLTTRPRQPEQGDLAERPDFHGALAARVEGAIPLHRRRSRSCPQSIPPATIALPTTEWWRWPPYLECAG